MKRLRSLDDDLDSVGEKGSCKDWGRRDQDLERSSSHRRFYSKAENGRKGLSSSSSYDRGIDDDREAFRSSRKRVDHDSDGFDRRKSFDRYRDCSDRGVSNCSPRNGHGGDRIHRSESFSNSRREFPKGYMSERERERERERSRREESVSSWRRFSGSKETDEDPKLGAELGRGSRVVLEERVNVRSPQGSRDVVKSPNVSKDSGGEQSRSSEVKKNDEVKEESNSSSEMEEGELEPEPETESKLEPESKPEGELEPEAERVNPGSQGFEAEEQIKSVTDSVNVSEPLAENKFELSTQGVSDGKQEGRELETVEAMSQGINGLQECHESSVNETDCSKESAVLDNESGEKEEIIRRDQEYLHSPVHAPEDQDIKDESAEKSLPLEVETEEKKCIELEAQVEDNNFIDSKELSIEESRKTGITLNLITGTLSGKDKGKSVAVSSSCEANSMGNSQWFEKDLLACRDETMEGPSSRGFELFSSSIVTRSEKTNHSGASNGEKLKTEPLELSLALPNVLLPLPSHGQKVPPSSPSRAMSIQSLPNTFRTSSDGFSGSMSFSGSQTFLHNPSCSLTQNSFENYEQSVGSHPLFKGIDQVSHITWPGQSSNEPKRLEAPTFQRVISYGNGSHASPTSQGMMYSHSMQGQQLKVYEGSSGVPVGLDRQSSLARQLSGLQPKNHIEVRSPTNSVGSRETRSEFSKDKKWIVKERSGSLFRSSSQREMEQLVIGGIGFVERIITMIVSEPVQVMARRIEEMAEQSITFLKESACEIIVNKDKRGRLHALQEALQNRSDLTLEILPNSHRAQLEILVAFKTGLQDFLQRGSSIPSSDLAEIFHNLRCRNLACLSPLPVDECDCKVCVQKNGFCSACMCLICSKFDMALNTCSWVGCDVCLHWCHTDCGIRESYIRNGRSAVGAQEATEMQFHCVACDHPSEMFGFVKEVFKTCAKEWKAETLSKELEYVKRIFSASSDIRGKQLHNVADQMIAKLETKSNLSEVYNHIMRFLTESNSEFGNTSTISSKDLPLKNPGEESNGIAGPSQVSMWLPSVSTENGPRRESASTAPLRLDWDQMGGRSGNLELEVNVGKKPVVDELESIIRIKHAEAKMFQARADDARREAEGLKRIAVAKNEKIDEEYSSRITKLHFAEAEERRKQKLDALKVLEREHREYFSMKTRMEADIRDLLLKMEATKRNFST